MTASVTTVIAGSKYDSVRPALSLTISEARTIPDKRRNNIFALIIREISRLRRGDSGFRRNDGIFSPEWRILI
ncbi:MAG: hypothetical protein ACR2QC_10230 [Gammaproteobacteria bacterium]